jgi:predicted ester cyclase
MSTEKNKANIRRHVEEVWNKGNLAIIPELLAPNYVAHPLTGDEVKGTDGFKQMVVTSRTAMPDLRYTIDSMVAEGDVVAVRYTATGTFTGKYGDIKPTGKKMKRTDAIFHRFEGGKQVEAWTFSDTLSLYQQLGIPVPAQ